MTDFSPAQLEELRESLQALQLELEGHLLTSRGSDAPVAPSEAIGRLSRMDAIQQKELAGASRRSAERRLSMVKAALIKLAGGDYGVCRECEEPISIPRLRARPETVYCLGCQSARESH